MFAKKNAAEEILSGMAGGSSPGERNAGITGLYRTSRESRMASWVIMIGEQPTR
jgi:hypothetical protein